MHRDMAMEVEAIAAASAEDQQRACDLWRADFNNCRPHESLGMKTPSHVYTPSATSYAGKKVDLLYPERMLVRTVSGRGFIKYRSTMIPLTEALAGFPVAIDPHSGPPHDLWFSHRRIGFPTLDAPRPSLLLMSLLLLLSMTPQRHKPDDPTCPRDHLTPYQGVTCLPSVPSPGRPSLLQPFTLTTKMRPDPVTQVVGVAGSGLRPAVQ